MCKENKNNNFSLPFSPLRHAGTKMDLLIDQKWK